MMSRDPGLETGVDRWTDYDESETIFIHKYRIVRRPVAQGTLVLTQNEEGIGDATGRVPDRVHP